MRKKKRKSIFEAFKGNAFSKDFLIFFSVIVIVLFALIKKVSEPQMEDFTEILKAKGIVIDSRIKKGKNYKVKYFQYRFEYQGDYYVGEVSDNESWCNVGDSCIIRFAKEDPNVNKYFETIRN